jgi:signal transduction histidine kinase
MNIRSTAARGKFENVLRKVYAAVLAALTIELWAHQAFQAEHFNMLSNIVLAVIFLSVLGVIASAWQGRWNDSMLLIHGLIGVLAVFLLPAMALATFPNSDYENPWVWWCVGISSMSVAVATGLHARFVSYLAILITAWTVISTNDSVGGASLGEALQGSIYVVILSIGVAGIVTLSRDWTNEVDAAHTGYLFSALERASVDATERDNQRVGALVHDKVLHTFLFAAAARTPSERLAAVELAREAVDSIAEIQKGLVPSGTTTPSSLFLSLRKAAIKRSSRIRASVYITGLDPIPLETANAITEATLQAIENAERHAKFTNLELKLNSPAAGVISVQIVDDGRGFRMERVPRARLGIRGSIIDRMALVGGVAKIKSSPGLGTVVSLKWPK